MASASDRGRWFQRARVRSARLVALVAVFLGAVSTSEARCQDDPESVRAELESAATSELELDADRLSDLAYQLDVWNSDPPEGYELAEQFRDRTLLKGLFEERCAKPFESAEQRVTARFYRGTNVLWLANMYEQSDDRAAAVQLLRSSIAAAEDADLGLPFLLALLADIERDSGNYEVAQAAAERGLALVSMKDRRPVERAKCEVQLSLGQVYLDMGMTDVALDHLQSGLDSAVNESDPYTWGGALYHTMNMQLFRADYNAVEDLWEIFDRGRLVDETLWWLDPESGGHWRYDVSEEMASMLSMRRALAQIEAEFRGLREPGESGAGVQTILKVFECGTQSPDESARAHTWLAQGYLNAGEIDLARTSLVQAAAILASITGDHSPLENEIRFTRVRAALLAGEDRAELESLLNLELLPAFEEFLLDWESAPVRSGGLAYLQLNTRNGFLSSLIQLVLAVHGEVQGPRVAIEQLLRIQALGNLARGNSLPVPALSEVQQRLTTKERGLLLYVAGKEHSHLFAIDRERISHHELAPAHVIEDAASRLVASIAALLQIEPEDLASETPTVPERLFERARSEVSELLFAEEVAARVADWNSVLLSGLDGFGYVPFELLGPAEANLGLQYETTYLPSIPVALWLEERAGPARPGTLLLLGGDGEASGELAYPALPLRASEFAQLADGAEGLGAGHISRLASEVEGGWADGLDLHAIDLFHFVGHGHYDSHRERAAGLLVQPSQALEGVLFADEVEALEFGPRLAMLTACGSGRTRLRRGDDGRSHLGGAFLQAGSAAVVFSYTNLEYHAALDFMQHVYDSLGRGESVACALLEARHKARPAELGVHPVHSSLIHVHGFGGLRFAPK